MDDTGRIGRPLTPGARRLVFTEPSAEELMLITEVDRAHLVMLAERGIVDREAAGGVLTEISRLRAIGFAPLLGREARRGLYLLYEDWLAARLSERTAGVLRTGRSRNDLGATVFLLGLRGPYQRLMGEVLRLQAILLRGARRHAGVVMPAYTHYQAAFPTTLGHYLAGVALALDRDIEPLARADSVMARCPLGAAAGGGTSVPIDPDRTASLLGFEVPVRHSLDAVAAREPGLRLLASASVLGVTLSRLATDLLIWTTAEFGFLALPDELVGSSSALPQKRNPFLLEHVKGRAAAPLGAFVAAATSMHATPFANSIAVGTEGCAPVRDALGATADAAALLGLMLAGARPQPEVMLARARAGYTTASVLAEDLALGGDLSFREAHRQVGVAVTEAGGGTLPAPEPVDAVAAARHGAGPGSPTDLTEPAERRARWVMEARARTRRFREASGALDAAVAAFVIGTAAVPPPTDRRHLAPRLVPTPIRR